MIHVRVPATTANLGPGFDTLGMALSLYGDFYFEETEEGLFFENVEDKYQNEKNLAVRAYDFALEKIGKTRKGLFLKIISEIPVARGLGSSASLIVAGIEAACKIHEKNISKEEKLKWAAEMEGHPDNAAPALCGGLMASMMDGEKVWSVPYPVSEKIKCCVLIPPFPLSTREARRALPSIVSMKNAVFNVSHAVLFLKAMEMGNMPLLQSAMRDTLHEPYREKLIYESSKIRSAAFENGAAGCVISGAGPSLLCLYEKDTFFSGMEKFMKTLEKQWRIVPVQIDREGAVIMEE